MLMIFLLLLLTLGFLYAGVKFYHSIDWEEPPEPSPDLRQMHKRQAELLHIQDVLQEAFERGQVSKALIEEVNRFCGREIDQLNSAESDWKNRRRKLTSSSKS